MSSGCALLFLCATCLALPTLARAQGTSNEASEMARRQAGELSEAIARSECETDEFQRDTILVCGEVSAAETQRHRSVLPEPVESDRIMLPGLNDPPCWVVPRGGTCMRGGWAPPPVVLIDLDQFPDALTPEEAAAVFRVEDEAEDN